MEVLKGSNNNIKQQQKRLFQHNDNIMSTIKFPMINEDIFLDAGYYLHKKPLGEGGFGKVRLATHLRTNEKVAIKMMNKEKLGQDLQRVRIEVEALKILQHDNIAKMLQVIETDTDIYLVLEYCNGGELFDYLISKRRLTETEVRIIMKDLFKVLLYIHNRGFAHRDLKPENILFDSNHRIKLIDFGLAANSSKNKAALSFLQTCCGSPAYAAPELLRGLTYSGPAVDVWSAGILLYSLLVGQLPFDDDNMNNLYKKIQIGHFTMPQWLSSDVRDLISSMLRSNPVDRITVAKALDHRWIRKLNSTNTSPTTLPVQQHNPLSPIGIDLKVFTYLKKLFPQMSDEELRGRLKLFGYVTATYLLLKNNPQAIKNVQESIQLGMKPLAQQQQELSIMINQNQNQSRIAAVKRKLQLDCDSPTNLTSVKNKQLDGSPLVKKIKETPKKTTILNSTPITAKVPPSLIERKQMLMNSAQKTLTPQQVRKIKSPKLNKKSTPATPMNDENLIKNTTTINSKDKDATTTIKSPLRDMRNQIILSPKSINNNNNNNKPTPSSKKSILRRLMESATPAKLNSPRKLDTTMPSNNITMTAFKEPQECIDHLTKTLRSKDVECKQKNFTLKCFYSDRIHSSLKFELEICHFNGLCCIHRKRLNGDAWNYKKICELILHVSNEQQLAILNHQKNSETETRV